MELRKLFTATSVIPCDLLRSRLDAHGIPSLVKNEYGAAAAGYALPVPGNPTLAWAWPEVWVHADDYDAARELLAADEAGTAGEEQPAA